MLIHSRGNAYAPGGPNSGPRAISAIALSSTGIEITFSSCVNVIGLTGIETSLNGGPWVQCTGEIKMSDTVYRFTCQAFTSADELRWRYVGGSGTIVDCDKAEDIGNQQLTVTPLPTAAPIIDANFATGSITTGVVWDGRASAATFINGLKLVKLAAVDTLRTDHWTGNPCGLFERAQTNELNQSRDLTLWASTGSGTGTVTLDATGIDGNANTATTVTSTSGSGNYGRSQTTAGVTANSDPTTFTFCTPKTSGATAHPTVYLRWFGGTLHDEFYLIDTDSGTSDRPADVLIEDMGNGFWKIAIEQADIGSNTSYEVRIYAGDNTGSPAWTRENTLTGSNVFDGCQLLLKTTKEQAMADSIIFSEGAPTIRAADAAPRWSITVPQAAGSIIVECDMGQPLASYNVNFANFHTAQTSGPLFSTLNNNQVRSMDGTLLINVDLTGTDVNPIVVATRWAAAIKTVLGYYAANPWIEKSGAYDGAFVENGNFQIARLQVGSPLRVKRARLWDEDIGVDGIKGAV